MKAILVLLAWLIVHAPAMSAAEQRVDVFDTKGRRTGHAVVQSQSGRVDFYDTKSRRTGWGQLTPTGRVEIFTLEGKRQGEALMAPQKGGK